MAAKGKSRHKKAKKRFSLVSYIKETKARIKKSYLAFKKRITKKHRQWF